MRIRLISTLVFLLFSICISAQMERSAVPFAFSLDEFTYNTYDLPSIPDEDLLEEDFFEEQFKAYPYRFAYDFPIELNHNNPITPSNPWTWIPLDAGGGIWTISIYCPNALALGLTFEDFHFDKGVTMIVYNESLEEVIGHITYLDNNTPHKLSTIPISGDRIFIELYIPAFTEAEIEIGSVSCVYKETGTYNSADDCQLNALCEDAEARSNQLSSVVRIISNRGTDSSTGVLVNSNSTNSMPYIITSKRNLNGNPANWSFLFNYRGLSCFNEEVFGDFLVSCGAEIIKESENSDLVLLRLLDSPSVDWNTFYNGWNRSETAPDEFYSIHNAYGGISKLAIGEGQIEEGTLNGLNVWKINQWESGRMDPGSLGAPLFDSNGLVTAFFVGGDVACSDQESNDSYDYFVPFHECWLEFKPWLDPRNDGPAALSGRDPVIEPNNEVIANKNISVFPIPAEDHLYIFNGNEEEIESIDIYDALGQFIERKTLGLNNQRLDISDLPNGWYIFVVNLKSFSTSHKVVVK